MKYILFYIFTVFLNNASAQSNRIGYWLKDEAGLPCFKYIGNLPFKAKTPNGQAVKLPEDPWFLLGNYRLTLFNHVSGGYELITGQRAWGRMNQGAKPNSGLNSSSIEILNSKYKAVKNYLLTGMKSIATDSSKCKRVFGCGFANYEYSLDEVTCKRTFSVKPSTNPYNGFPAFLLSIKIRNKTNKIIRLAYTESITANYEMMQQQRQSAEEKKVKYKNIVSCNKESQIIKADIKGVTGDSLFFPTKESISPFDGYPPTLFVKAVTKEFSLQNIPYENKNILFARCEITLNPKEEKELELIIGYSFESNFSDIEKLCSAMMQNTSSDTQKCKSAIGSFYANQWLKVLPKFETETDQQFKQELIWHAYNLEAMATYNDFFGETQIPQGTIYDYDWGLHASARDQFQHALPLIYYNPALAKSVLKNLMKRTTAWGEIRLIESGYGFVNNSSYQTSDQQLYFFMLLSEYLRVTKDYGFLLEQIECFPIQNMPKMEVLEFVEKCFIFLRDQIGTGSHGLVRLMNSDWNDAVFYIVKVPYNKVVYSGESHMNSAMAITVLGELIPILKKVEGRQDFSLKKEKLNHLCQSMIIYRKGILNSFIKDLGDRTFSKRMYFDGKSYGDNNMFLEPQGYMMQIKELSIKKKKALYEEMKSRIYKGEKLGAREQETPEFEDDGFDKGSRENGGFWYALNGPVINGIAQFDKAEAMRLLKKMSLANSSKNFPNYWSSYWSSPDNIESSLISVEGLPDQTWNYSDVPVYCAHPHAWILYCYFKINE